MYLYCSLPSKIHIFSFSILFNNFSSSVLNVFLSDDGGLYSSPIITLRFVLNNDLLIYINTDSNTCVEKDIFVSGFIWYRIQNINTYPPPPFI